MNYPKLCDAPKQLLPGGFDRAGYFQEIVQVRGLAVTLCGVQYGVPVGVKLYRQPLENRQLLCRAQFPVVLGDLLGQGQANASKFLEDNPAVANEIESAIRAQTLNVGKPAVAEEETVEADTEQE